MLNDTKSQAQWVKKAPGIGAYKSVGNIVDT